MQRSIRTKDTQVDELGVVDFRRRWTLIIGKKNNDISGDFAEDAGQNKELVGTAYDIFRGLLRRMNIIRLTGSKRVPATKGLLMDEYLWDTLGGAAFGFLLVCLGLFLLGEYRRLFSKNLGALFSIEIWSKILMNAGGPVYIAMMVIACGALLILQGVWAVVSHI